MKPIFVFGSNLQGRHGLGAAKYACLERGAIWGKSSGLMGSSYAIPTKDRKLKPLPKHGIAVEVIRFNMFSWNNPDMEFQVTRIGCGLAGYRDDEIAFLFTGANHNNTKFDEAWRSHLPIFANFWGTHTEGNDE
ncbi:hypothetical protein D3C87_324380 [compost metagenome]